jgi:hypothetical protein
MWLLIQQIIRSTIQLYSQPIGSVFSILQRRGPIPRFWNFHRILKPLELSQSLKFNNHQNLGIIRIIRTLE